jgi:hypothetical protein
MTAKQPPVPPEQQNPHQTPAKAEAESKGRPKTSDDASARGRQDNLTQNMTNKGHQQDR